MVLLTRQACQHNELYPIRRTIIFAQRSCSCQRVVSRIFWGAEHYNVCFRCEIKVGFNAFPVHNLWNVSDCMSNEGGGGWN